MALDSYNSGNMTSPKASMSGSLPKLSVSGSLEPSYSLQHSKSFMPQGGLMTSRQQAQADVYLSELLSYSLERLRKEPEILKDEKQQLDRSLQAAAVSQYRAFIETADCLQTISTELGSVFEHLDLLLQGIPELASSCESFSTQSGQVLDAYAQNKQLASQQPALVELLEVPQLMDTCARNGVYDEALNLQEFVSRMAMLHPNLPVVKMLMTQVNEVRQSMLQQLLGRLKTGIQLPECLRVMGYLRRMGAFSEADLRMHFLKCRDEFISTLMMELDDTDPYEYAKHLTDIHRLHLFDAVMQYRAIFFDTLTTTTATAPGSNQAAMAAQDNATLVASLRETSLLHSWVQHRLNLYVAALTEQLPAITQGSNLASVLEHCVYCGNSLARVGLDFTGLLQPLFQACTLQLLSQHLAAAVDGFNTRLEGHKWVPMHTPIPASKRQQAGDGDTASKANGSSGGTEEAPQPPYVLMEHLPLAIFANGVLTALNEMRQCALQSCIKQAAALLQQATEHMAASLGHYKATHNLSESEAALFKAATRAALDVLLPYLATCFTRVFQGTGQKLDTSGAAGIFKGLLQDA